MPQQHALRRIVRRNRAARCMLHACSTLQHSDCIHTETSRRCLLHSNSSFTWATRPPRLRLRKAALNHTFRAAGIWLFCSVLQLACCSLLPNIDGVMIVIHCGSPRCQAVKTQGIPHPQGAEAPHVRSKPQVDSASRCIAAPPSSPAWQLLPSLTCR